VPREGWVRFCITLSVMVPTLLEVLDTSVANVALSHIQGSLSAGQEEATWVLTSYLVANAVVIPMSGWLSKLFGRKNYLLLSIVVFTASSALCGMAWSLPSLIFFRIVQGLGGGGLQPLSQAILMETYPPAKRGMAMSIFGMGVVLGPILGPLLGGWITDNWTWRWIFYINLPIGVLALWMCWNVIEDPHYQVRLSKGEKVDVIGLALLSLGIGCLQIVLDKGQQEDWFSSDYIVVLAAVSAVSLVLLVYWELTHDNPVLDLRVLKNRSFAIGNVVIFLGFFAFFGSIVLLPMFLQQILGYTSFQAGLVLGPGGLLTLLALPVAGKLPAQIDARFLLALGLCVTSYSLWYMARFNMAIDMPTAVTGRLIQGVGMPFFFVCLSLLTMASVPNPQMNAASALFSLFRNLGGSFGTAFVTTLLARRVQVHQNYLIEHLTPFDSIYAERLPRIGEYLSSRMGDWVEHTQAAAGLVYQQLQRQAATMAYNDANFSQAVILAGLVGLVFFMRPAVRRKAGPGPSAH